MPPLWKPDSWSERLAELEARTGDLKEAPLRRDVRSLGMLLGEVLREQAGDALFEKVEELRLSAIRRREALAEGSIKEAEDLLQLAVLGANTMPVDQAYQLSRAFAFYFELINLAETNHRKRRRLSIQLSGETVPSAARSAEPCAQCIVSASPPKRPSPGCSESSSSPSSPRTPLRSPAARF